VVIFGILKHSSLLPQMINYSRKEFYKIPRGRKTKVGVSASKVIDLGETNIFKDFFRLNFQVMIFRRLTFGK
jgi:hypothetical protein